MEIYLHILTYAGDDCRPSPASPLVLLPPLNLLTGTCRWSATAAAPAMGVRGLSGVREITELGWELMSTCQTKPQVARRYTVHYIDADCIS